MIVVADTGPLNYLIQIEQIDILRTLFETVLIPAAVRRELIAVGSPGMVSRWGADLPPWIVVVADEELADLRLKPLDIGERHAIAIALAVNATALLMDDLLGRAIAISLGLRVTGTLAVLRQAEKKGLANFDQGVQAILALGFERHLHLLKKFVIVRFLAY